MAWAKLTECGSPPHTWGRRARDRHSSVQHRFTPTHVGKTPASRAAATLPTVHPHTRGEDGTIMFSLIARSGSPPHTWGRRMHGERGERRRRFTPTHVGKTPSLFLAPSLFRFTPTHVGKTDPADLVLSSVTGSPPHTWGRRPRHPPAARGCRFTPTHVGKTAAPRTAPTGSAVHPHTRGEDWRARSRRPSGITVHPHTRGEDRSVVVKVSARSGPPPHTWGRPAVSAPRSPPPSVHPHTRGEDDREEQRERRERGSPPHTWGRPIDCHMRPTSRRFTPTHVGKT